MTKRLESQRSGRLLKSTFVVKRASAPQCISMLTFRGLGCLRSSSLIVHDKRIYTDVLAIV